MMSEAYYNEIEPYAVRWLSNLMDAGEIAPGTIDDRSILDVTPRELFRYDRCHFFAGIAGWDYALRLAGWPADIPVWTGSCPCQPFSTAGKRGGGADERHLWPAWYWLIRQCRPPIIFGEQVASKDGLKWLDVVFADLEAEGYACGAVDLCAASVGAPHIRQRLWFVAMDDTQRRRCSSQEFELLQIGQGSDSQPTIGILGNASGSRPEGNGLQPLYRGRKGKEPDPCPSGSSPTGELAYSELIRQYNSTKYRPGSQGSPITRKRQEGKEICQDNDRKFGEGCPPEVDRLANPWVHLHWLPCRDGKLRPTGIVADTKSEHRWNFSQNNPNGFGRQGRNEFNETSPFNSEPRPTESIIQPLADGLPSELGFTCAEGQTIISPLIQKTYSRVGRLKAYGNAINPYVAKIFIEAVMEILSE